MLIQLMTVVRYIGATQLLNVVVTQQQQQQQQQQQLPMVQNGGSQFDVV